jgi:hypothetical protein
MEGSLRPSTGKARGKEHMNYQILFAALCALIAGHILVAIIAIIRAFREERTRRFSGFAPGRNGRSILTP